MQAVGAGVVVKLLWEYPMLSGVHMLHLHHQLLLRKMFFLPGHEILLLLLASLKSILLLRC
jgi:hypothetical protein